MQFVRYFILYRRTWKGIILKNSSFHFSMLVFNGMNYVWLASNSVKEHQWKSEQKLGRKRSELYKAKWGFCRILYIQFVLAFKESHLLSPIKHRKFTQSLPEAKYYVHRATPFCSTTSIVFRTCVVFNV